MKRTDITKHILAMHESETLKRLAEETKQEVASGVSDDINAELEALLNRANEKEDNVVSFVPNVSAANESTFHVETELLAAAGQSLGEWFSQPINFTGAGFVLDVRRVLGTKDEVDLYLEPIDTDVMSNALNAFKGRFVNLTISNDGTRILTAELYIDESGSVAEGSGALTTDDQDLSVNGKISIDIEIQD